MLPEDIEADYWAHHYRDNPATESVEDEDFDVEEIIKSIDDAGEWEEVNGG